MPEGMAVLGYAIKPLWGAPSPSMEEAMLDRLLALTGQAESREVWRNISTPEISWLVPRDLTRDLTTLGAIVYAASSATVLYGAYSLNMPGRPQSSAKRDRRRPVLAALGLIDLAALVGVAVSLGHEVGHALAIGWAFGAVGATAGLVYVLVDRPPTAP